MAFDVSEYHDLLRLLEEHPEWKAELRSVLLSDDLLRLPDIVREVAEAQQRAESRLDRIEKLLEELAQAQLRTEKALLDLTERVDKLADAQQRTENRVDKLADAQQRTEASLNELVMTVKRLVDDVGDLKGDSLERKYTEKAGAYFGSILRNIRVITPNSLEDTLEEHLSPEEMNDLLQIDLLISGKPKPPSALPEVWLAVEVSSVVDKNDVLRAKRRAALLLRAGYNAIAVVAGQRATQGAEEDARNQRIVLLQDGRILHWAEALKAGPHQ